MPHSADCDIYKVSSHDGYDHSQPCNCGASQVVSQLSSIGINAKDADPVLLPDIPYHQGNTDEWLGLKSIGVGGSTGRRDKFTKVHV